MDSGFRRNDSYGLLETVIVCYLYILDACSEVIKHVPTAALMLVGDNRLGSIPEHRGAELAMKKITYRYLPPVGPRDRSDQVTRSLAYFVQEIPYFLTFNLIPPLSVMNEEFRSGEDDAGMSGGCAWEPFDITKEEFDELVQELQNRGMRYVEPPQWVKNKTDWHIWKCEYELGIPSDEHYRLSREEMKWAQLSKQAAKAGDREQMLEYHLRAVETGQALARFVSSYVKQYHAKKQDS